MKQRLSLRLRVTLVCGLLLAACCLLLTLSHNYYAYEMADAIEAIPLQPAVALNGGSSSPMEELSLAQATLPVRRLFRVQSLLAMGVIVAVGCLMVYWLTGKALAPLRRPDEQIRSRTAAASFNQMSQNLSQAFAQQKRFSQCAAHELRTPLTVLKTRMALFRKKGLCSTPETDALLRVLEEQTQRLSDLVGDLLALSNMDTLECGDRVDVPQLLADTVEDLLEPARQHQVSIQLHTQPGTVLGNRTLLERAFFNLVENAVKYNRPNGTVTVSAACTGGVLRVEITDQGIGIPQELLQQVFEPFFRVDPSRSRQLGGAGLGLSLVRAIAELHNGQVWAEPAPGGGSRFVLLLPESGASPA